MKKVLSILLALVLCLSLCACGKSEAVKNVEAMIDALGEITLESIDAIRSAEDAYSALTEDEQKKVSNYETLTSARDSYYELALVGEWCVHNISLYDIESMYTRLNLRLNADMTAVDYGDGGMEISGPWSVTDGRLTVGEVGNDWTDYIVFEEEDKLFLESDGSNWSLMRVADFHALLDDIFLVVDVSEIALNEYFGFSFLENIEVDTWGEPTGHGDKRVRLTNQLYEQGWLYLSNDESLAIEIAYPEHHGETHHEFNGTEYWTKEAGSITLTGCPFTGATGQIVWYIPGFTFVDDLSVDQLSFGRAKGTITYINQKYVKEVKADADSQSRVLITDFSVDEYFSGAWFDDFQY